MEKILPLSLTRDELIAYTPEWTGERSDDGRPRVSDDIIERMRSVTITQAWGVLFGQGFRFQFEGDWLTTHPDEILCGRAATAMFMPRRESLHKLLEERAKAAGNIGDQVSWPIYTLQKGDVYVADVMGKIERGPIIGDNLSVAVLARTGNGVVHDAAVRDVDGLKELKGFASYFRGVHPTYASPTVTITGINCPVKIGGVMVMPGDVVLGRGDGIIFIPPHLAERVVITSELIRWRDRFGKQRIAEGKYLSGEIDGRWAAHIEEDFSVWLTDFEAELTFTREQMQELLKNRTW
ncbi:MAG: RraA family protein [Alphaproteobacteria bacterium]|nr:RraA family protein [Alphaproteobacteria bacterium]